MRTLVLALIVFLAACAHGSPARAVARAELSAGTSGDYPPLSLWNGGQVEGFAPSLLTAFASAEKREIGWRRFRWPTLSEDLRSGRFEIAADGITVGPERSLAGRFTVPIARGGAVLLLLTRTSSSCLKNSPALGARSPLQ